jgi:hypothetical protein
MGELILELISWVVILALLVYFMAMLDYLGGYSERYESDGQVDRNPDETKPER